MAAPSFHTVKTRRTGPKISCCMIGSDACTSVNAVGAVKWNKLGYNSSTSITTTMWEQQNGCCSSASDDTNIHCAKSDVNLHKAAFPGPGLRREEREGSPNLDRMCWSPSLVSFGVHSPGSGEPRAPLELQEQRGSQVLQQGKSCGLLKSPFSLEMGKEKLPKAAQGRNLQPCA